MDPITETTHDGEAIVSEAAGTRSRKAITILSGSGVAAAMTVLAAVATGMTATPAAGAGNTGGSGTIASVDVALPAKVGVYTLTCIEPDTNAGTFQVEDPEGVVVGVATVAVEFDSGGLTFTITDATDFVAGDSFTITVAAAATKYVPFDHDGTDGSQIASAILFNAVDATNADVLAVGLVRDCEVNGGELVWPSDIDADEKAAAVALLETKGIIVL